MDKHLSSSLSPFGIPVNGSASGSHGLSGSRKVGIALGTLAGCAALAGMLTLLYMFIYRRRHPLRRAQLDTLLLYRTHRQGSKNSNTVGLADTEDVMKLGFVPSLGKSKSVRSRRESSWKNLEDYEYDD
jgi:hypothetical protein